MSKRGFFQRFLDWVERAANKLPEPVFLFCILAVLVIIISAIASAFNVYVTHPGTGESIYVISLLNKEGLQRMLVEAVDNFIYFPPLGVVLATIVGIGVADKSGFFAAALRHLVSFVPKWIITPTLIFASVNSNLIADSGFVVLPPLGALLFMSVGKHPIAGIAASYAGICGGFSANLLITALDPLLSGFTQAAAQILDPNYIVFPTANYFFMIPSAFLVTIVCTVVTVKIVEPRLGKWKNNNPSSALIIYKWVRLFIHLKMTATKWLMVFICRDTCPADQRDQRQMKKIIIFAISASLATCRVPARRT